MELTGKDLISKKILASFRMHKPYKKFNSECEVIEYNKERKSGKRYRVEFKNGRKSYIHFQQILKVIN